MIEENALDHITYLTKTSFSVTWVTRNGMWRGIKFDMWLTLQWRQIDVPNTRLITQYNLGYPSSRITVLGLLRYVVDIKFELFLSLYTMKFDGMKVNLNEHMHLFKTVYLIMDIDRLDWRVIKMQSRRDLYLWQKIIYLITDAKCDNLT